MSETHFGKDCPVGKVQIEFVGVDPALRYSNYGWKPCDHAFIDAWVDGKRFHVDVGNFTGPDGTIRRGLRIIAALDIQVDHHSVNALDVYLSAASHGSPDGPDRETRDG